ncbi:MAG: YggU family protein [Candidatus Omnitrophica bacterium]|nr:YggU family protein [Candidatus Omnitrophota bacterium]
MNINIKVIPGAKRNFFKEEKEGVKVYLTAPAVDGKANKALVDFLAKHFKARKSHVEIIKGLKSRHKTISILNLAEG